MTVFGLLRGCSLEGLGYCFVSVKVSETEVLFTVPAKLPVS